MVVNGKAENLAQPISIADYLKQNDYQVQQVVVERNYEIISQENYESVMLQPEDIVEILSFVGGG